MKKLILMTVLVMFQFSNAFAVGPPVIAKDGTQYRVPVFIAQYNQKGGPTGLNRMYRGLLYRSDDKNQATLVVDELIGPMSQGELELIERLTKTARPLTVGNYTIIIHTKDGDVEFVGKSDNGIWAGLGVYDDVVILTGKEVAAKAVQGKSLYDLTNAVRNSQ